MSVPALFDRARALHVAGDFVAAENLYRQVLATEPRHSGAMCGLAELAYRSGRNGEAVALIDEAAAHFPHDPMVQLTRGIILGHEGRFEEAIDVYRHLTLSRPELAEAYTRMATPLLATGRAHEAIEACRKSLTLRPDHMPTVVALCSALSGVGDLDEVVRLCRDGLVRHPDFRTLYVNLGWALREQGKVDEAIACYREALAHSPHKQIYDDLLFTLHFSPTYGREDLYREHRNWAEAFVNAKAKQPMRYENDPRTDRKLRLGYVAHELGNNPLGRFLLPILENHDRALFEVYIYCDRKRTDPVADRLATSTAVWRPSGALSDERLAAQIADDRIDVLVDLIMHSNGSRLLAFARKPAPVQVTYLAYCSTTGLESIDYRLTDEMLDPPGSERWYSEKTVHLPGYWCYPRPAEAPDVGPLPAMTNGYVTFGCLNEYSKVSKEVLATWCDVLRRVPNSKLILHAKPGSQRAIATDLFAGEGIDPARVEFVGRLPLDQYFAQYNRIDIGLDPLPYAGGTTTCDALWMGVPVVTLAGNTAVGRGGVGIYRRIDPDKSLGLVACGTHEYASIAANLSGDRNRLAQLRNALRVRMSASPLTDGAGFTRGYEDALRRMWRTWCEGHRAAVR